MIFAAASALVVACEKAERSSAPVLSEKVSDEDLEAAFEGWIHSALDPGSSFDGGFMIEETNNHKLLVNAGNRSVKIIKNVISNEEDPRRLRFARELIKACTAKNE